MRLDQVFYGRGKDGYALLGASVPECGLTDSVENLCRSVGTPGFEDASDNCPFLLQKPLGDSVLMVCGRNGACDSMGRGTLFFHALILPRDEMEERGISAFDLYDRGLFKDELPQDDVRAVEVGDVAPRQADGRLERARGPVVVRCKRARNLDVARTLLDLPAGGAWATFTWNPLKNTDFQCVDAEVPLSSIPAGCAVLDESGKVVREGRKEVDVPRTNVPRKAPAPHRGGGLASLLIAIMAFTLGFCVAWLLLPRQTETVVRTESVVRDAPRLEFDERFRIADFDRELGSVLLKTQMNSDVVRKVGKYVDFVNLNCPAKGKKEDGE